MSIRSLRDILGINQIEFARRFGIPLQTVRQWESRKGASSHRDCPDYVETMIGRLIAFEVISEMSTDIDADTAASGTKYVLMHKDVPTCLFDVSVRVRRAVVSKKAAGHFPLALKRVLHFQNEYVERETDNCYVLNANACRLMDMWLEKRNKTPQGYGRAADDCYWIRKQSESVNWTDVYDSNENALKVVRKADENCDILCIREVVAGIIYDSIGYENYSKYEYITDENGTVTGVQYDRFTDGKHELVTAYDLLEEYNLTRRSNAYEKLPARAAAYGIDAATVQEYLDTQTLVDYLITNRSRDMETIAFLRDPDSLKIIGPAPVFGSGSCLRLEGVEPEGVIRTTVTGFFGTEDELLKSVKNIKCVDMARLPNKLRIIREYAKSRTISDERLNKLAKLYGDKQAYLWDKWMGGNS